MKRSTWVARAIVKAETYYSPYSPALDAGVDRNGKKIRVGQHVFIRKGTHHHREARVVGTIAPPFKPMLIVNLYFAGERNKVDIAVPTHFVEVVVP